MINRLFGSPRLRFGKQQRRGLLARVGGRSINIAACLLLMGSPALAAPAAGELPVASTLTLCHEDNDVFPWVMKSEKGLAITLIEIAAARQHLKVQFVPLPWRRCLLHIATGLVDGGFGASYGDERAEFAEFPMAGGKPDVRRRMYFNSYSLYRLNGSAVKWDGNKFQNLNGPVGVQKGYSIIADLKKMGAEGDDGATSAEANLRKLIAGRVQAIAQLTLVGDYLLRQPEFAGKAERVFPPLIEKTYFLIFGKDYYRANRGRAEELWNQFENVRSSGEYQKRESALLGASQH